MLYYICYICLNAVVHIINSCLEHRVFPNAWKTAVVHPIPKKAEMVSYSDFRPISILPVLSKLLEKLVHFQLSDYLFTHHLLPERQSGFRPLHSTTTVLADFVDDCLRATDGGQVTLSIMLDYSKAFDSLDHSMLLSKLHYVGVDRSSLLFFQSYLEGRQQVVSLPTADGTLWSSSLSLATGVPQGSVLGPLLFVLYMFDLPSVHLSGSLHQFADDSQIYYRFPPAQCMDVIRTVNDDLAKIVKWSMRNALQLNSKKTIAIIFGSAHLLSSIDMDSCRILLCGDRVAFVDSCRYLGVVMDAHLSFSLHVSNLAQLAYGKLKLLFPFLRILSTKVKLRLVQAFILSSIDYCDAVYGPALSAWLQYRVQLIQNSCLRFAAGVLRRDHITPHFIAHGWIDLRHRRLLHVLTLVHKILVTGLPVYLCMKFTRRGDRHDIALRNVADLHLPAPRSSWLARSFCYVGAKAYNLLPRHLRLRPVPAFRHHLRDWVATAQF